MPARAEVTLDAIPERIEPANDAAGDQRASRPTRAEAEAAVRTLLRHIGEDPEREGLRDTPRRFVSAWHQMFDGYERDADDALGRTFEEVAGFDDLVLVRDIAFHSHCEHHAIPVIGRAHVAYLPADRVVGLSKIAHVVDIYARRLQTQETMTAQIARTIQDTLAPRGVAVMVTAEHLCMAMRGIRKPGTTTSTTAFTGTFEADANERARFLATLAVK